MRFTTVIFTLLALITNLAFTLPTGKDEATAMVELVAEHMDVNQTHLVARVSDEQWPAFTTYRQPGCHGQVYDFKHTIPPGYCQATRNVSQTPIMLINELSLTFHLRAT